MTNSTDYQGNNTYIGDTTFGVARPNYTTAVGVESVTSNMEFFSISTAVDIRTAGQSGGSLQSQLNLNKLIEIVSLRGQPVIMGAVTGTGPYVITLVSEHAGAWANAAADTRFTALNDLLDRLKLDGINYGFGANVNGVNDTSLSVTFNNPQVLT